MGLLKNNFRSPNRIVIFLLVLTIALSLTESRVFADKIGADDSQYSAFEEEALEEPAGDDSGVEDDVQPEDTRPVDIQPEDVQLEDEQSEYIPPEDEQPEDVHPDETQPEDIPQAGLQQEYVQPEDAQSEDTQPEDTLEEGTSFTYDPQPLTLEQVLAAINSYEAEYRAVLVADGFSAAIAVPKPHWQYHVAEELMPPGYYCELVDEESDVYDGFGAPYYTFYVEAVVASQVIDGGTGIIVETTTEFRDALANAAYTTIYLGADITMTDIDNNIIVPRDGQLVITGIVPGDDTVHTYTDYSAFSSLSRTALGGNCTDIVFRDMNMKINNTFGIYYFNNSYIPYKITLDNVTLVGRQVIYGVSTSATLVIKNSDITMTKIVLDAHYFAQNTGKVLFEGDVTVSRENVNRTPLLFNVTNVEIADDADVFWDDSVTGSENESVFKTVINFTVGKGARFVCYSGYGFCEDGNLTNVSIAENADVKLINANSHSGNSLYGTVSSTFRAERGSKFLLYDNQSDAGRSVCHFTNIILNSPESFIIMNPSTRVVGTNTPYTKLSVTGVSSIRYYPSGQISKLFNTGTYTPSRILSYWWAQTEPFNVDKPSWPVNNSSMTTDYHADKVPGASVTVMDTLTEADFTAGDAVHGVEIYGTIYKLNYDSNNANSGTAPESDTGVPGDQIATKANTGDLVREGYKFTGWNTKPDGSGIHYDVGTAFHITKDTTLYADWEQISEEYVNIIYYANDGSEDMFIDDGLKDTEYVIAANRFNNDGFIFTGWNTHADGGGEEYDENEVITLMVDIKLYAQWEEIPTAALVFRKIDAATADADVVMPLLGAVFKLYYCNDSDHVDRSDHIAPGEADTCWDVSDIIAVYDGSIVSFDGLEDGFYLLMETVSPDGYQLPRGQWVIRVEYCEISFIGTSGNTYVPAVVTRDFFDGRESDENVEFWIGNIAQYELPTAGAGGTFYFTALGSLLMAAGLLMVCLYRRRRSETGT